MDIILQNGSEKQFYDLLNKIETGMVQSCDGFLVREPKFPLLKHYFTFAETDENGIHWFFITMKSIGSVQIIDQHKLYDLAMKHSFSIEKVIPFIGNQNQRRAAIERGMSCEGKTYQWVFRNCENLMNYIQTGKSKSVQTRNIAGGVAVVGGVMMMSKNKAVRNMGAVAGIIGLLVLLFDWLGEDKF